MRFFKRNKSTVTAKILNAEIIDQGLSVLNEINDDHSKKIKKELYSKSVNKIAYVLDFKGDIKASQVQNLKKEIDAIIFSIKNTCITKEKNFTVIINIHSPGGTVTGYGLAAAQIARLRAIENVKVIATVDEVAASGGYMMASVCHEIYAAPMAMVGSIGVVLQMPNVKGLLNKIGVEMKSYTAGKYKRTVTPFETPTEEGVLKLNEDLEYTHNAFKEHINQYRPDMDIESVATGEVFFGQKALDNKLIDKISTYNDTISELSIDHKIIKVENKEQKKKNFLGQTVVESLANVICDRIEIFLNKIYNQKL